MAEDYRRHNQNLDSGRRANIRMAAGDIDDQYRAFDRLPKPVRDLLNDAPIRFCAVQLDQALNPPPVPARYASFASARDQKRMSVDEVCSKVRQTIRKWQRQDRQDMENLEGIWEPPRL